MARSPDHLHKRCPCPRGDWLRCAHPWHLRYAHAGREHRVSLEREREAPGAPLTQREAIKLRDKIIGEIHAGKRGPMSPAAFTFGDVCAAYEKAYVNIATRRPAARAQFEIGLRFWRTASVTVAGGRRARLDTVPMRAVTRAQLEEVRSGYRARQQAAAEAWRAAQALPAAQRPTGLRRPPAKAGEVHLNRATARARHLFNWALINGFVTDSPFRLGGVNAIRLNHAAETPRDRRLAPNDEEALLRAAKPHLHAVIVALLETGCRPGEILALRWRDVDLDAGLLALRGAQTKTSRPRAVPITQRLRAVLDMRREALANLVENEDETARAARLAACYVFGDEIGQRVASVKTAWHSACRAAGIAGLHLHDCRREFASRLLESSVELHVTRTWLGHASIATTSRYLAVTITGLQAAAKRFEAARDGAEKDSSGDSRTNSRTTPALADDAPTAPAVEVSTVQ